MSDDEYYILRPVSPGSFWPGEGRPLIGEDQPIQRAKYTSGGSAYSDGRGSRDGAPNPNSDPRHRDGRHERRTHSSTSRKAPSVSTTGTSAYDPSVNSSSNHGSRRQESRGEPLRFHTKSSMSGSQTGSTMSTSYVPSSGTSRSSASTVVPQRNTPPPYPRSILKNSSATSQISHTGDEYGQTNSYSCSTTNTSDDDSESTVSHDRNTHRPDKISQFGLRKDYNSAKTRYTGSKSEKKGDLNDHHSHAPFHTPASTSGSHRSTSSTHSTHRPRSEQGSTDDSESRDRYQKSTTTSRQLLPPSLSSSAISSQHTSSLAPRLQAVAVPPSTNYTSGYLISETPTQYARPQGTGGFGMRTEEGEYAVCGYLIPGYKLQPNPPVNGAREDVDWDNDLRARLEERFKPVHERR